MRLTPANEHVPVADDDLIEPLTAWDITARRVRRPDLGTMNETWIVDHRGGRSVLRRHRTTDIEAVRREHAVIDHVRAKGIPVPDIITKHDGDRVTAIGGRLYTLYSSEPGEHPPHGRAGEPRSEAAGRMLARIHRALEHMPGGPPDDDWPPDLGQILRRVVALEQVVRRRSDPRLDWILADLDSRRSWLLNNRTVPEGRSTDLQMIHGDYQLTNVLFEGDAVSCVVDWDRARRAWPAMEVVRALDHGLQLASEDSWAFLTGYRQERSLADDELERAVEYWTHRQAQSLWLLERLVDADEQVTAFARPFRPFDERWRETVGACR